MKASHTGHCHSTRAWVRCRSPWTATDLGQHALPTAATKCTASPFRGRVRVQNAPHPPVRRRPAALARGSVRRTLRVLEVGDRVTHLAKGYIPSRLPNQVWEPRVLIRMGPQMIALQEWVTAQQMCTVKGSGHGAAPTARGRTISSPRSRGRACTALRQMASHRRAHSARVRVKSNRRTLLSCCYSSWRRWAAVHIT